MWNAREENLKDYLTKRNGTKVSIEGTQMQKSKMATQTNTKIKCNMMVTKDKAT